MSDLPGWARFSLRRALPSAQLSPVDSSLSRYKLPDYQTLQETEILGEIDLDSRG